MLLRKRGTLVKVREREGETEIGGEESNKLGERIRRLLFWERRREDPLERADKRLHMAKL